MKTIWKKELKIMDIQEIEIPEFSKILAVQVQNNIPRIWFLCDPNNVLIKHKFRLIQTKYLYADLDLEMQDYIGTFETTEHSDVPKQFDLFDWIIEDFCAFLSPKKNYDHIPHLFEWHLFLDK